MQGRTHGAIGCATALTLLGTTDIKVVTTGVALAVVGSYIVDIDASESKGRHVANNAIEGVALLIGLGLAVYKFFDINILNQMLNNGVKASSLIGILAFAVLTVIGTQSSHRGFMHSIVGLMAFSLALGLVVDSSLVAWFMVGYVMHILADTLNKKPVRILYPLKGGFCMHMCVYNGIVNYLLFVVSTLVIVYQVVELLKIGLV